MQLRFDLQRMYNLEPGLQFWRLNLFIWAFPCIILARMCQPFHAGFSGVCIRPDYQRAMKKLSRKNKIMICMFIFAAVIIGYLSLANYLLYYRIHKAGLITPDTAYAYEIKISGSRSENGIVYSVIGDSLTSGVGVDNYEDSYPYLVASKLSYKNGQKIELKTFSYPGARSDSVIKDLLDPAIASNPDMVTVLIGVNDVHSYMSVKDFIKNYDYMLGRLTRETHAKIYVIGIPDLGADSLVLPPYNYYFAVRTKAFNDALKPLAAKYTLHFIDLNVPAWAQSSKDREYYSRDLFHPSANGYRLWAQTIYDKLN